ncbi:hypothetical protein EON65_11470 [archaeon]|nr:MAG: hypothetical protein EON65_11470 [archaeon]
MFGTSLHLISCPQSIGRVENKDVFVDLRKNDNGIYLKLSERRGNQRKTVLIPASGIARLKQVLDEANAVVQQNSTR